jgi:hypothetical protein
LLRHIEENGEITFSKACRLAKANQNIVENMLANFNALGIIEPVFNEHKVSYQITTAGNFTF